MGMNNAALTSQASRDLAAAINAIGSKLTGGLVVSASAVVYENCTKKADGTYTGEIVKLYHVEVSGRKLGTPYAASRTLTESADADAVVADCVKQIKAAAKAAKAAAKFQPERAR